MKIVVEDRASQGIGFDKVDERPVRATNRWNALLALSARLPPLWTEQRPGASQRAARIIDAQRHRTH